MISLMTMAAPNEKITWENRSALVICGASLRRLFTIETHRFSVRKCKEHTHHINIQQAHVTTSLCLYTAFSCELTSFAKVTLLFSPSLFTMLECYL